MGGDHNQVDVRFLGCLDDFMRRNAGPDFPARFVHFDGAPRRRLNANPFPPSRNRFRKKLRRQEWQRSSPKPGARGRRGGSSSAPNSSAKRSADSSPFREAGEKSIGARIFLNCKPERLAVFRGLLRATVLAVMAEPCAEPRFLAHPCLLNVVRFLLFTARLTAAGLSPRRGREVLNFRAGDRRTLIVGAKKGWRICYRSGGDLHFRIKKQVNYLTFISTLPEGAVPVTAPMLSASGRPMQKQSHLFGRRYCPVTFSHRGVFSHRRQQDGVIITRRNERTRPQQFVLCR